MGPSASLSFVTIPPRAKLNDLDTFNPIDFEAGNELRSDSSDHKSFAYDSVDISLIVISYIQGLFIRAHSHEL